jgi:hypothetical protein
MKLALIYCPFDRETNVRSGARMLRYRLNDEFDGDEAMVINGFSISFVDLLASSNSSSTIILELDTAATDKPPLLTAVNRFISEPSYIKEQTNLKDYLRLLVLSFTVTYQKFRK